MRSESEFGDFDDATLRQALFNAYDSMGPSDEALDRMFANISGFASASVDEFASTPTPLPGYGYGSSAMEEEPRSATVASAYQPSPLKVMRPAPSTSATVVPFDSLKRKRRLAGPLIASAAACLVVVAGIGALALSNYDLPRASDQALNGMFTSVDDFDSDEADAVLETPADPVQEMPEAASDTAENPATPSSSQGAEQQPADSASIPETSSSAPATVEEGSVSRAFESDASSATVTSDNGDQLVIVTSDSAQAKEADASLVSKEVALGVVHDEALTVGITCIIYEYDGDEADYAIEVDGTYYLADAVSEPTTSDAVDINESNETDDIEDINEVSSHRTDGGKRLGVALEE